MKRILLLGCGGAPAYNFLEALKISEYDSDSSRFKQYIRYFIVGADINPYHLALTEPDKKILVLPVDKRHSTKKMNRIIEEYKIEFIHAQPDIEVKWISDHRDELDAKVCLPPKEVVDICQDKLRSWEIWDTSDITVPDTVEVEDHDTDDIKYLQDEFGLPFWLRATQGAGGRGSTLCEDIYTAINWIYYWRSRKVNWQFIAQEYLPGRNFAWQSLWQDGELITSQGRERLEYIYPFLAPSRITGTPVVARTIHNEHVNQIATKAVLAIDPHAHGIYSVDLKEDKNGIPNPTEINVGRFFTTNLFTTLAAHKLHIPNANIQELYLKVAYNELIPNNVKQYNPIPPDIFYIRHIDCGYHLCREVDGRYKEI